jgi:hypothetical protein
VRADGPDAGKDAGLSQEPRLPGRRRHQGEKGLLWYDETGAVAPARAADRAERVIDTNGAGDVFHGAYVYSYLNNPGKSWQDHFEFARAASTFKIQRLGNEAGLPTLRISKPSSRSHSRWSGLHLQLVGALVAPEPRQAVIGLGVAGQPRRDAAGMVGGVLHRLQPQRAAEARARIQRAIADCRDIRIGRQQMLVDDDAGRDRQASFGASSTLGNTPTPTTIRSAGYAGRR